MTENVDSYATDEMDAIVITVTVPNKFKRCLIRAKTHVVENKKTYIVGTICLVAGVILGRQITKKTTESVDGSAIEGDVSFLTAAVACYKPTINNVDCSTTIINEEPVKRLSYIIKMGDRTWQTQREFAEEMEISELHLSQYLNGKRESLGGLTPERLGVRSE